MPTHLTQAKQKAIRAALEAGEYDAMVAEFYDAGRLTYPFGLGSFTKRPTSSIKTRFLFFVFAGARFFAALMGLSRSHKMLAWPDQAALQRLLFGDHNETTPTVLDWISQEGVHLEYLRSLENHYRSIKKINQALKWGSSLETMRTQLLLLGEPNVDPEKEYEDQDPIALRKEWSKQLKRKRDALKDNLPRVRRALYDHERKHFSFIAANWRAFIRWLSTKPTKWDHTHRAQKLTVWCKENVQAELNENSKIKGISLKMITQDLNENTAAFNIALNKESRKHDRIITAFSQSLSDDKQREYLAKRKSELKNLIAMHANQILSDLGKLDRSGYSDVSKLQSELLTQLEGLLPAEDEKYQAAKKMVEERADRIVEKQDDEIPSSKKDFSSKVAKGLRYIRQVKLRIENGFRHVWHARLLIRCHFALALYSTIATHLKELRDGIDNLNKEIDDSREEIETVLGTIGENPKAIMVQVLEKYAPTTPGIKKASQVRIKAEKAVSEAKSKQIAFQISQENFLKTLAAPIPADEVKIFRTMPEAEATLKAVQPKTAAESGAEIFYTRPVTLQGDPEKAMVIHPINPTFSSVQQTLTQVTQTNTETETTTQVSQQVNVKVAKPARAFVERIEPIRLPKYFIHNNEFVFSSTFNDRGALQVSIGKEINKSFLETTIRQFTHTAIQAMQYNLVRKRKHYYIATFTIESSSSTESFLALIEEADENKVPEQCQLYATHLQERIYRFYRENVNVSFNAKKVIELEALKKEITIHDGFKNNHPTEISLQISELAYLLLASCTLAASLNKNSTCSIHYHRTYFSDYEQYAVPSSMIINRQAEALIKTNEIAGLVGDRNWGDKNRPVYKELRTSIKSEVTHVYHDAKCRNTSDDELDSILKRVLFMGIIVYYVPMTPSDITDYFSKSGLIKEYHETFDTFLADKRSLFEAHGLWSYSTVAAFTRNMLYGLIDLRDPKPSSHQLSEMLAVIRDLKNHRIHYERVDGKVDIDLATLLILAKPTLENVAKYAKFLTSLDETEKQWLIKIYLETRQNDLTRNLEGIQAFFEMVRTLQLTLPSVELTEVMTQKSPAHFRERGFCFSKILYLRKILQAVDPSRAQHYLNNCHNILDISTLITTHQNMGDYEVMRIEQTLREGHAYFYDYRMIHRYTCFFCLEAYESKQSFKRNARYWDSQGLAYSLAQFLIFVSLHYPNMRLDKEAKPGCATPDEFAQLFETKMEAFVKEVEAECNASTWLSTFKTDRTYLERKAHEKFISYVLTELYEDTLVTVDMPDEIGVVATLFAINDLPNVNPHHSKAVKKLLTLHQEYKLVCSQLESLDAEKKGENKDLPNAVALKAKLNPRKEALEKALIDSEAKLKDHLSEGSKAYYDDYQAIIGYLKDDFTLLELIRCLKKQSDLPLAEQQDPRDLIKAHVQALQKEYQAAETDTEKHACLLKFLAVSYWVESNFAKEPVRIRPVQFMAILHALKNPKMLPEVDTGEGKTMTIRHIALAHAFMGHNYDVITHTDVEANNNAKETKAIADYLGFTVGTLNDVAAEYAQKGSLESPPQIVFGAIMPFAIYKRAAQLFKSGPLANRESTSAAVDEADAIALEYSATTTGILPTNVGDKVSDDLKVLYRAVNTVGRAHPKYTAKQLRENTNALLDEWIKQYPEKAAVMDLTKGRLADISDEYWITLWYDPVHAAMQQKQGDTYIVEKPSTRIVRQKGEPEQKLSEVQMMNPITSGERGLGSQWSLNVHQLVSDFAQREAVAKETPDNAEKPFVLNEPTLVYIPPLAMPKAEVGVPSFLRSYQRLTLMSATLGNEVELKRTMQMIQSYPGEPVVAKKFPRHTSKRRYDFKPVLAASKDENCQMLLALIMNARGQAVRGRKNPDGSYNWVKEALPYIEPSNAQNLNPNAHDWYAENAAKSILIKFQTVEEVHAFSRYLSDNQIFHNTLDDTNDEVGTRGHYATQILADQAHKTTFRPGDITLCTQIGGRAINFRRVGASINAKLSGTQRGTIQHIGRSGRKYLMGISGSVLDAEDAGVKVGTPEERTASREQAFLRHHHHQLREALKRCDVFLAEFKKHATPANLNLKRREKLRPLYEKLKAIHLLEMALFAKRYTTTRAARDAISRWDEQVLDLHNEIIKVMKKLKYKPEEITVFEKAFSNLLSTAVTEPGIDPIDQAYKQETSLPFFGQQTQPDPIDKKQSTISEGLVNASERMDREVQINEAFQVAFADLCWKMAGTNQSEFDRLWKRYSDFYPDIAGLAKRAGSVVNEAEIEKVWTELTKPALAVEFEITVTPMKLLAQGFSAAQIKKNTY